MVKVTVFLFIVIRIWIGCDEIKKTVYCKIVKKTQHCAELILWAYDSYEAVLWIRTTQCHQIQMTLMNWFFSVNQSQAIQLNPCSFNQFRFTNKWLLWADSLNESLQKTRKLTSYQLNDWINIRLTFWTAGYHYFQWCQSEIELFCVLKVCET